MEEDGPKRRLLASRQDCFTHCLSHLRSALGHEHTRVAAKADKRRQSAQDFSLPAPADSRRRNCLHSTSASPHSILDYHQSPTVVESSRLQYNAIPMTAYPCYARESEPRRHPARAGTARRRSSYSKWHDQYSRCLLSRRGWRERAERPSGQP